MANVLDELIRKRSIALGLVRPPGLRRHPEMPAPGSAAVAGETTLIPAPDNRTWVNPDSASRVGHQPAGADTPWARGMDLWPRGRVELWGERAAIRQYEGGADGATAELLACVDLASNPTLAPDDPSPYPWREIVATWPDSWRERWGRLANELAGSGMSFPEDEALAFTRAEAERQASRLVAGRSESPED